MSQSPLWIAGVKKIAVLRANALGDYIFVQPALYALRSAYPQAEIIYLGKAWHAEFIAGRPGPVDRAVAMPPTKGISESDTWSPETPEEAARLASALDQFVEQMQAERFDLALQMHGGGGYSNPLALRVGAKLTAGLKAPGAPELDRWTPYYYWQHEVIRMLEVVGLVGAPPVTVEPHIEITDQDRAESCEALPPVGRSLVILHPGAGDPRRRWPAERFAEVGDTLARQGHQVVLVGIPDERVVVEQVHQAMQEPVLNLCGALSLNGLAGLLARAALVIANDSGPRHLAEAAGTPTVGIYWCGNVINAGAAFRAKHRPHLSWRLECPVCGQNTIERGPCQHGASFVDGVPVAEVLESALDLLQQHPKMDR